MILLVNWCGPESDPSKSSLANRNSEPTSAEFFERPVNLGVAVSERAVARYGSAEQPAALVEGLAFTWSPKSKSAVLKSVMRRLRITDTALAEEGYQELLTRGGLEKRPHPSLEGVRNVQRLMQVSNPRVGEVKLEEIVDRSLMRKLEDSGFIERMYNLYPAK